MTKAYDWKPWGAPDGEEFQALELLDGRAWFVKADALRLPLADETVDLIVTSPPYNTLWKFPAKPTGIYKNSKYFVDMPERRYQDKMEEPEYQGWQVQCLYEMARVLKPTGSILYNHKLRYENKEPIIPLDWIRACEALTLRQELVWDRGGSVVFNARMFPPADERVYWLVKDKEQHYWGRTGQRVVSVRRVPPARRGARMACPYPEDLIRPLIEALCPPGGLVVDPFVGSGTTLRVAVSLGMRAYGFDLTEEYLDV